MAMAGVFAPNRYTATPSRWLGTISRSGMVTSPNHLASQAGVAILRKGGNAVEAAISVASTLAVVYPHMAALGGDGFWLVHNARTGDLLGINASGRAGKNATIESYKRDGYKRIPARGYLSANTVPGAVSGWDEAYRYSREQMDPGVSWGNLFSSAILYAEAGFPVSTSLAKWLAINVDPADSELNCLQRFAGFRKTFLKGGLEPYGAGEILRQSDLSKTLRLLAQQGASEFYSGEIANRIVADLHANGGMLTMDDFAEHRADWVRPLSVSYRDTTAYNLPPNTQGMASLAILNILNRFDLSAITEGSAEYCHLLIEATKEAFLDRDKYLSDPVFAEIPLAQLLSNEHAKAQANRIDFRRAASDLKPLDPNGDTAWIGVVDRAGNCVSLIQSIYHDFGSAIVPEGTGMLLQNRGSYFSLDPDHANRLEPGKRTLHTLNPAMLFRNGKPFLIYGTMGGEGQPQTQAAIVTRIVDYNLSPQDAIEAPRWLYGRTWGAERNDVKLESRFSEETIRELTALGHPTKIVEPYSEMMGHAGAILIQSGALYGASDPRGDGLAAGF
jgi:gamma-glutamyltranspeptidase